MSVAVVTRTITVHSPQGKNKNRIQFSGTTWDELKSILIKEGYNIDSMKAVESINKATLEGNNAIVPDQDFYLHLYPVKTRSGSSMSRAEINETIKAYIATDGQKAKDYFNKNENYTRKKSTDLEKLISKYKPSGKVAAPTPAKKAVVKATVKDAPKSKKAVKAEVVTKSSKKKEAAVAKVVASVAESKDQDPVAESIEILESITGHEQQYKINKAISLLKSTYEAPVVLTEVEENDLLRKQHEQFRSGLKHLA